MNSLLNFAKAILSIAFSVGIIAIVFLIYQNPAFNYQLRTQLDEQEKVRTESKAKLEKASNNKFEKLKEWRFFEYGDVDNDDNTYPISVIRSGFKVIRFDNDQALVGWVYDVANISEKNQYILNVNFNIVDEDGFVVATSAKMEGVPPTRFRTIQNVVVVKNEDLPRLNHVDWNISLTPSWSVLEIKTEESRYARLSRLLKNEKIVIPYAIEIIKANPYLVLLDNKWKAIKSGLEKQIADYDRFTATDNKEPAASSENIKKELNNGLEKVEGEPKDQTPPVPSQKVDTVGHDQTVSTEKAESKSKDITTSTTLSKTPTKREH